MKRRDTLKGCRRGELWEYRGGMLLIGIAIISFPAMAQTGFVNRTHRSHIKIGFVTSTDGFDGAGCSLQFLVDDRRRNARYIFLSDYNGNAIMNIDGLDMRLKLISRRDFKGDPKPGRRSTFSYVARKLTVRVDYVVTRVCEPNDEACEVTWYDATITVTSGRRKQVARVAGVCGS